MLNGTRGEERQPLISLLKIMATISVQILYLMKEMKVTWLVNLCHGKKQKQHGAIPKKLKTWGLKMSVAQLVYCFDLV